MNKKINKKIKTFTLNKKIMLKNKTLKKSSL